MKMGPIDVRDLIDLLPYALLVLGALTVMALSVARKDSASNRFMTFVSGLWAMGAAVAIFVMESWSLPFQHQLIHDRLGVGFSLVLLGLLLCGLPVLLSCAESMGRNFGGVLSLLLLSACGGLLTIFSNNLLVFFVGIELLSLPLYVATSLGADSKKSSEAAFKYFLLGSIASALYLYGAALVWGGLGTLTISDMASTLATSQNSSPQLVIFGGTLILLGVSFKLGLVPFHMWVPDVYEAAPSPVVAWMSGAVKAAIIPHAIRIFGSGLPTSLMDWPLVLSILSAASMIWGSIAALQQQNVKRLLAYSSIAHAGYMGMGLVCASQGAPLEAGNALVFYVLTYGLASAAAFIILSIQEEGTSGTQIQDLAGLAKRRPALAVGLAVSLLSLAGFPPLGGFIGKFNIFSLALRQGHLPLVLIAVVTSVISLGYYLRLIVAAYMQEPLLTSPIRLRFGTGAVLSTAVVLTLILGLFPDQFMRLLP